MGHGHVALQTSMAGPRGVEITDLRSYWSSIMRVELDIRKRGARRWTTKRTRGWSTQIHSRTLVYGHRRLLDPVRVSPVSTMDEVTSSSVSSSFTTMGSDDELFLDRPPARDVAFGSLFDQEHVQQWTPQLILYTPIGTVIAVVRMALWVLGVLIDSPGFRQPGAFSIYLKLLGLEITWKNLEGIPAGKHVLVSNHISVGDLNVLFPLPQRYIHLITPAIPARVTHCQNLPVILRPATPQTYEELGKKDDPTPIHVFPDWE